MSFEIFKFTVPFHRPFHVAGKEYLSRSGLYFVHKQNVSEASPLFNISDDDIQKTLSYVEQHHLNIDTLQFLELPPYIQWGLYSQSLGNNKIEFIPSNALLAEPKEVANSVIKVKMCNQDYLSERKLLEDILKLNPQANLRLDANNGWSLEQAIFFTQELPPAILAKIEYIEEPLQNMTRAEEFYEFTQVPYALDQSLDIKSIEAYKNLKGLKKLILKPSSQNTPAEALACIKTFPQKCVITTSLDTEVGLKKLKQFIHHHHLEKETHGLDTLSLLDLNKIQQEKIYEL